MGNLENSNKKVPLTLVLKKLNLRFWDFWGWGRDFLHTILLLFYNLFMTCPKQCFFCLIHTLLILGCIYKHGIHSMSLINLRFSQFYSNLVESKNETWQPAYSGVLHLSSPPNLTAMYRILLLLVVTICSAERTMSRLRTLKSVLGAVWETYGCQIFLFYRVIAIFMKTYKTMKSLRHLLKQPHKEGNCFHIKDHELTINLSIIQYCKKIIFLLLIVFCRF